MIIIPSNATLPNNPRLGWRNFVTSSNVDASSEADGFPAINLGNPATYLKWRASSAAAQTLVIDLATETEIDYIGIASHNLGSAGIAYELESSNDSSTWTSRASGAPTNDRVVFHEFALTPARYWRLSLSAGTAAPEIAVLYLGRVTILERRIYVGHTPITMGRKRQTSTGRSERGQFLGRIRLSETLESTIAMQNIDPDWYRDELDGLIEDEDLNPFFWAWRPSDFPEEAAFAWSMGDIVPVNQRSNGMMQFEARIQAIR
ncbi:MAG: discoidin domain-containing protein [Gammaproteobacteria bacterium]|nr:hypothetical protein [Gammaproteobacteria bacterium]